MSRKGTSPWRRGAALFLIWLAFLPGPVAAQGGLEILTPRHITVEQALPALRPLLTPGGAISGYGGKIMVRTDLRNLEEIRAALAAIDAPAVRLLVSVRRDGEASSRRSRAEVSGSVQAGDARVSRYPSGIGSSSIEYRSGSGRVEVGGGSRSSFGTSQASQQVQTVDDGQAYIQAGVSVPLAFRQVSIGPDGARVAQGTVFHDLSSGFYARPQVVGERVHVVISPFSSRPAGSGGAAQIERVETSIEGRLGEWIPLGTTRSAEQSGQGGWLQQGSQAAGSETALWLKVERLP